MTRRHVSLTAYLWENLWECSVVHFLPGYFHSSEGMGNVEKVFTHLIRTLKPLFVRGGLPCLAGEVGHRAASPSW